MNKTTLDVLAEAEREYKWVMSEYVEDCHKLGKITIDLQRLLKMELPRSLGQSIRLMESALDHQGTIVKYTKEKLEAAHQAYKQWHDVAKTEAEFFKGGESCEKPS